MPVSGMVCLDAICLRAHHEEIIHKPSRDFMSTVAIGAIHVCVRAQLNNLTVTTLT